MTLLTKAELFALPDAEKWDGGVYFLWQDEELVYIGGARNILDRANYQNQNNRYAGLYWTGKDVPIKHNKRTAIVTCRGQYKTHRQKYEIHDLENEYIDAYPTRFNHHEASRDSVKELPEQQSEGREKP